MTKSDKYLGNKNAVKEVTKNVNLNLRITEEKKAQYRESAADQGMKLSAWILMILDREIEKKGKNKDKNK